jgi:hypothetical protein
MDKLIFEENKTMKYDNKLVEKYLEKIVNDPSYWDEKLSIEFCIALKLKQIGAAFSIGDDLVHAYKKGLKNNNFFEANIQSEFLYKNCLNNPIGLSEFFQLFLKDNKKTKELFIPINDDLTKLKETKNINVNDFNSYAKYIFSNFHLEAMQLRYLQDKETHAFYWNRFSKKLEILTDNDVIETFSYFLNTQIDISEKFYQSGYIEKETGINEIEEALDKRFVIKKNISFLDSLSTKIKSFF